MLQYNMEEIALNSTGNSARSVSELSSVPFYAQTKLRNILNQVILKDLLYGAELEPRFETSTQIKLRTIWCLFHQVIHDR